jgi:hypothetical protein
MEKDPNVYEAVARLHSEVLADTAKRQSFADDSMGALAEAGIAADDIPAKLLETLSGLSFEELSVVARVNEALMEEGFSGRPGPTTTEIII